MESLGRQYSTVCSADMHTGGGCIVSYNRNFIRCYNTQPPQPIAVPITQFAPGIDKPNSMWTTGACLYPNGQCDTFAVIGNNVPNPPGILAQETTQTQLAVILQFDIATNGLKRDRTSRRVKLFPGVRRCSSIKLPKKEYPPREIKTFQIG